MYCILYIYIIYISWVVVDVGAHVYVWEKGEQRDGVTYFFFLPKISGIKLYLWLPITAFVRIPICAKRKVLFRVCVWAGGADDRHLLEYFILFWFFFRISNWPRCLMLIYLNHHFLFLVLLYEVVEKWEARDSAAILDSSSFRIWRKLRSYTAFLLIVYQSTTCTCILSCGKASRITQYNHRSKH